MRRVARTTSTKKILKKNYKKFKKKKYKLKKKSPHMTLNVFSKRAFVRRRANESAALKCWRQAAQTCVMPPATELRLNISFINKLY